MNRRWPTLWLLPGLALAIVATGAGCVRPLGPGDLKRELSAAAGVRLEREMGITVTRSGVWLARKILRWSDVGDEVPPLAGLRRVEVGVYRVVALRAGHDRPAGLAVDDFPDWEPLVRVHQDDEQVLVLVDDDDEGIHRLLVVVAEEEEWVLVRLKGDLDRILEQSIAFAFDEARRPDLYQVARDQRGLGPREPSGPQPCSDDYLEASFSSHE